MIRRRAGGRAYTAPGGRRGHADSRRTGARGHAGRRSRIGPPVRHRGPVPVRDPGGRLARLVTELTAPAVLATLLLFAVGWRSAQSGAAGVIWGLLAAVFASVIPFAYIIGGVRRGRLTDHHVGVREQRRLPLLVGLVSVVVGLVLLTALGAPRPVRALVAAGAVGLLIGVAVSHWWKMSIHTAVAAGAVVVLVLVFGRVFALLLPVLGLVGWSRVRLGDHTVAQVVVGGLVGGLVAGSVFAVYG